MVAMHFEPRFKTLVEIIDSARAYIHITTYILASDAVGAEIIRRLSEKASEGVKVRLLIDDAGSWRLKRRLIAPLISAGGEVSFFMPVFHLPFRGRSNLRNHRKLVVADGLRALTGGMNLDGLPMSTNVDDRRTKRGKRRDERMWKRLHPVIPIPRPRPAGL